MSALKWSGKPRRDGGFTLVEVVVALGIFAAAFGVLLAAHTGATQQQAHARKVFTATGLARTLLTETELSGLPEIGETEGDFGDDFPDYSWKQTVDDVPLETLIGVSASALGALGVQVPTGDLGLRQVTLTVEWQEQQTPRNVELIYFMVEP